MAPKSGFKPGHGGSVEEPVQTEVPDHIPRHRGDGRPWIRKPADRDPAPQVTREGDRWVLADQRESRRGTYYSRASSVGKRLTNTTRLDLWKLRTAVVGMSRDDTLTMQAQALPAPGSISQRDNESDEAFGARERELREQWDALAELAIDAGKGTDAAKRGSAFHLLSEREDRGEDLGYLPQHLREALDEWRRQTSRFAWHGTEQFVVCDELRMAGTYDRLGEVRKAEHVIQGGKVIDTIEPGERVIVDLKSGRTTKYFDATYCTQQLPYALGVPYSHFGGRTGWPDGIVPNDRWAAIPHVSHADGGQTSGLYWVNLTRARQAVLLLDALKEFDRAKDLFLVAEVKSEMPPEMARAGLHAVLKAATTEAELDAAWDDLGDTPAWDEFADSLARSAVKRIRGTA